jgi:poly(3-hydroxybutyrate) depolymerase
MRNVPLLLAALALSVLAACMSEAPLDACDPSGAEPCATATEVQAAGLSRRYVIASPGGDATAPRALVFVLHGRGDTGAGIRASMGARLEAAAGGEAVVVYPDGLERVWDMRPDGVDVALFDAILAKVSAQVAIDPSRVFVTGHSFGGWMSNALGCARPRVVRAIAPLSAGVLESACPGVAVAAWVANGIEDPLVSPSEGEAQAEAWRIAAGCASTWQPTVGGTCRAFDGCGSEPVVFCAFHGVHVVQGWEPSELWSFFRSLPAR